MSVCEQLLCLLWIKQHMPLSLFYSHLCCSIVILLLAFSFEASGFWTQSLKDGWRWCARSQSLWLLRRSGCEEEKHDLYRAEQTPPNAKQQYVLCMVSRQTNRYTLTYLNGILFDGELELWKQFLQYMCLCMCLCAYIYLYIDISLYIYMLSLSLSISISISFFILLHPSCTLGSVG